MRQLQDRRWEETEILMLHIDGQRFGPHLVISAVGVDVEGKEHLLGIEAGATENAAPVKRLHTHLPDQGLSSSWHVFWSGITNPRREV